MDSMPIPAPPVTQLPRRGTPAQQEQLNQLQAQLLTTYSERRRAKLLSWINDLTRQMRPCR